MFDQRYPMFGIFLALVTGIAIYHQWQPPFLQVLLLTGFSALFLIFTVHRKVFGLYRKRWLFGMSVTFFFIALGLLISQLHQNGFASNKYYQPDLSGSYLVQLLDEPAEKRNSYVVSAKIISNSDSTSLDHSSLGLMLYVEKSRASTELQYGDQLLIATEIKTVDAPKNPYQFDYRRYLKISGIHFQAYADSSSWQLYSTNQGWFIVSWAVAFRKTMLNHIESWSLGEKEAAVAKALLLGYRGDIDGDLLNAYSSAGAMHVLAVSGLHIGIVYMLAFYALFFLRRWKYGQVLTTAILMILLWGFALITGLSASVVRAATMFTFVAIGTGLNRHTSIYNTILGSAFFLLLFNPSFLFNVGFQLSYTAVLGIIWIQPQLYSIWNPVNWLFRQFWGITTVSIAAQLATFPLALFYFHQFPTLFLVSNWIAIPLVTILMYLGVIALCLSAVGWVPDLLVKSFNVCLSLMNKVMDKVGDQSDFLIDHIHITQFELSLLYIAIILFLQWVQRGGYFRLITLIVTVILFGSAQIIEQHSLKMNSWLTVYSIKDELVIGFYQSGCGILICDSSLLENTKAIEFNISNHQNALDIVSVDFCPINKRYHNLWFKKEEGMIAFANTSILLLAERELYNFKANLWIVSGNARPPVSVFYKPKAIILSGRMYYKNKSNWKEWAEINQLTTWDTQEKGAYSMKLKAP